MPELPEVETLRRGLAKLLIGKWIIAVSHDTPKSFPNASSDVEQFLIGAKVLNIKRRAKVLLIELDTKYTLVIHLKMTGQLVYVHQAAQSNELRVVSYEKTAVTHNSKLITHNSKDEVRFGAGHPNDSLVGGLPDRSTRVIFDLNNNAKLFFNDQRKFGWVRLIPTAEVPNIHFFKKVGPEPLAADFTPKDFHARLMRRKNSNIKAVLLDQTVIAGVGNIYADESLWGAKIHPSTLVNKLGDSMIYLLYKELRFVLNLAIEMGGSSDRNYVNAEGKKGSYLSFARVFRREGQACPRCNTTIIKTRVASRGTHTCPKCQKLTK